VTSARVSGALWDDIDRWNARERLRLSDPHARPHAWLTSGDEVIVPGWVCIVRPGSRRSAGLGRMTTMAVIGITGSTDGIGCDLRGLRSNGRCRLGPARIAGCERWALGLDPAPVPADR
jgi:hypothetical protein